MHTLLAFGVLHFGFEPALSQYLQCFEKQRSDNVVIRTGVWYWRVKGDDNDKVDEDGMVLIRTVKPKKLKD